MGASAGCMGASGRCMWPTVGRLGLTVFYLHIKFKFNQSLGWWQPPQKRHTTKNF